MAYNSANLVRYPGGYTGDLPITPSQVVWKYTTTTDNTATVFGTDLITGNPYWGTEDRLRTGDWVIVVATDGNTLARSPGNGVPGQMFSLNKAFPV